MKTLCVQKAVEIHSKIKNKKCFSTYFRIEEIILIELFKKTE
jgi:hypothetical protein